MSSRDFGGKVLRIFSPREGVVDAIVADEREYVRLSFFGERAEILNEVRVGDVLSIKNAYELSHASSDASSKVSEDSERVRGVEDAEAETEAKTEVEAEVDAEAETEAETDAETEASGGDARRLFVTKRSRIRIERGVELDALRFWKPADIMVLAVARPEKGKVCIAGIDSEGNWIRPQSVYTNEMTSEDGVPKFRNLSVSRVYVDAWRGRRPRAEDRFFIHCEGIIRTPDDEERIAFLERNSDASVKSVFNSGRTLGLIKAKRIFRIHEKRISEKAEERERSHETHLYITFQDISGAIYRKWPCRCAEFYKIWEEMRAKHKWTYKWRIHRMIRKNTVYLAIGLTYTDYGIDNLQFGAYPMVVGVHIVKKR